jgi:hypothetical protein
LKRAAIVEKWWCGKIKKETRQSEKLRKEVRSGEVEEIQIRRQEILASQTLNETESRRERIP